MIKIIELNASFIPLTKGHVAIVDKEDYNKLIEKKWHVNKRPTRYTSRFDAERSQHMGMFDGKRKVKCFRMHRDIMNPPKNLQVDHINGDTLDNRKSNLRLVTNRQNHQNRHNTKTSKYPGVCWDKSRNKWMSRIRINGKAKMLGRFESEEEAFKVYSDAVEDLGEEVIV